MSYIKIKKILKEEVDTPEEGYIYFGFDDPSKGPWVKDDDGSEAYYILSGSESNPSIVSISPTSSAFNGDTITINGTNFIPSITSVKFDSKLGLDINVLSVTQLTVIVPSEISGIVSIVVSTTYGSSLPVLYTINYKNNSPVISSIIPSIGSSVGSEISIDGYNFIAGETEAWFGNGISGVTNVINSTYLNAIIPDIPTGSTIVFLANPTDNVQGNIVNYIITQSTDQTFISYSPSSGVVGDTITITGTNFNSGEVLVYFGDKYASNITVDSDTQISADISTGTHLGETKIKVGVNILGGFTVNGTRLLPTITSILPLNQTLGGIVTLVGNNLDEDINVTFSGVKATLLSGKTSTSCQIMLSGDTSTPIQDILMKNIIQGVNSVVVTNKYGSSTGFHYTIPNTISGPTITSFSPTSHYRGNAVNLYGTNYIVGTGNAIYYGNVLAEKMNGQTTELVKTELSMKHPIGVVNIKIVNSNGSYTILGFTVVPSVLTTPTITSISPVFAKGGDTINIYGTNLTDGIISFGYTYPGTGNTTNTMLSTQLQTILPNGLVNAGKNNLMNVYVTTTGGTYTYSSLDVYETPTTSPYIVSFSILSGSVGTLVTLTGNFFTKYYTELSVYVNGVYYMLDSQEYISSTKVKGYIPDVGGYTGSVFIRVATVSGTDQKAGFTII